MYPLPAHRSPTVWGLQVPGTWPLPRDGSFFFFHGAGGGEMTSREGGAAGGGERKNHKQLKLQRKAMKSVESVG